MMTDPGGIKGFDPSSGHLGNCQQKTKGPVFGPFVYDNIMGEELHFELILR